MTDLIKMGQASRRAQRALAKMSSAKKEEILLKVADSLEYNAGYIIEANRIDYEKASESCMKAGNLDRLKLDKKRVNAMADGLRQVAGLSDPIGRGERIWKRPNGLRIEEIRVPIGVIGIVYESRPNVTSDAFGICFKTGNACILRGGSDSVNSAKAIGRVIRGALESAGAEPDSVQVIEDPDRNMSQKC